MTETRWKSYAEIEAAMEAVEVRLRAAEQERDKLRAALVEAYDAIDEFARDSGAGVHVDRSVLAGENQPA